MASSKGNTSKDVRVIDGWHGEHRASYHPKDHVTHFFLEQERCPFGDHISYKKATLVIGDKAMPMSQVEAMADEVARYVTGYFFDREEIARIVSKYGVKLS